MKTKIHFCHCCGDYMNDENAAKYMGFCPKCRAAVYAAQNPIKKPVESLSEFVGCEELPPPPPAIDLVCLN